MEYLFTPQPIPTLPVVGQDHVFPVHRIYCVGRNYADHAKEMGGDPSREQPFFFSKPGDAIVPEGGHMPYPQATNDLHHEIELVVALKSGGKNLSAQDAKDCIFGYATGLDLTRRDLQAIAKEKGRPWDYAKGFDQSAPCSAIVAKEDVVDPENANISLTINGELRQQGKTNQMIRSITEVIVHLSELYELKAGDLIYTGTPAGVGPINKGDQLIGSIDGLPQLELTVG